MNSFILLWIIPLFFVSILIPLSANSWFTIWMGLELNLALFIFMSLMKKTVFSCESTMKYFLIQAIGSMILLLCFSCNFLFYEEYLPINSLVPPLALAIKSGMAPLHVWVPEIISKLPVINIYMFLTIQKVNPLLICFSSWFNFMWFLVIANIIVGAVGGLNQSCLYKLLIYSSINNIGWLIMSLLSSMTLFWLYFVIYGFLTYLVMNLMNNMKMKWIIHFKTLNWLDKIYMFSTLLSLGGLPPLLGFYSKWLVIYFLQGLSMLFVIIAILMSVLTLYFYLKSCISSMIIYFSMKKWSVAMNSSSFNAYLMLLNFSGFLLFSFML